MIYLDNSATTRVLTETADAVHAAMTDGYFNPASAYAPAVAVERTVNTCRQRMADALGCAQDEMIYTSGGTESNNMAVLGTVNAVRGKKRIITCMTEHPSVYEVFRALESREDIDVVYLDTDASGAASMEALSTALTQNTVLVSLMHVNNETGSITNLAMAYRLIRKLSPDALFHVDGVQAFCKLPFSTIPCDLYSISGHKFHAPKGVGVLYLKNGIRFAGGQLGGGQERGLRSGTTNVPGIVGMDASLAAYRQNHAHWIQNMRACKQRLSQNLLTIPDVVVNGPSVEDGAGHILNLSFLGVRGEVLLNALSERQICVSTGSACSAHKHGKNRVLNAIGVPATQQDSAIRFSFCPFNTMEEMDIVSTHIQELVTFLRKYKRR
ncbi:MAG: cysteine desulfurase family protein [Clostridia bacterium]